MGNKAYRVRQLAQLGGLTVRTLHHYDAIGLLKPARRAGAGARIYGEAEVLRLQQILIYRELGLPLEQIKAIVDDSGFDIQAAQREQRDQLLARAEQTTAMIAAVDEALRRLQGQRAMNDESMFGGFDAGRYDAEVKARWGDWRWRWCVLGGSDRSQCRHVGGSPATAKPGRGRRCPRHDPRHEPYDPRRRSATLTSRLAARAGLRHSTRR